MLGYAVQLSVDVLVLVAPDADQICELAAHQPDVAALVVK